MTFRPLLLVAAAALACSLSPARAQSSALTAISPTTIAPGGSVDFLLSFSKLQDAMGVGFGEPEPAPALGNQTWLVSSTTDTMETLTRVQMEVMSSHGQGLGWGLLPQNAGPGSLFQWSEPFTLTFHQPGSFQVTASGGWESVTEISDTSITGQRSCVDDGAGGLSCSPWTMIGVGGVALLLNDGQLAPMALSVQVVPEPQTLALWLAGLAGLGWGARRQRSAA